MSKNQVITEKIWNTLCEDSDYTQRNMDQLHRKQTGSYYTSMELTLSMMRELVNSLDDNKQKQLYKLKFLEPCVGTGNFVFAYLRVCCEQRFTKKQYEELVNNIYVCDINSNALKLYKKNMRTFVRQWFGIELQENYFNTHIGGGLLFDVDEKKQNYIPISSVFDIKKLEQGFDIVATNPPYKNLKAERGHYKCDEAYVTDKQKYAAIAKEANEIFSYSTTGTLNLYKLFIEEIVDRYLSKDGICSILIPSSILSDKMCTKLRTHLLESCAIKSVRLIAEDSAYVDASQALCALLLHKGKRTEKICVEGSLSKETKSEVVAELEEVVDKDTGNAILVLSKNEYYIRNKMKAFPKIKEIDFISNLRGELDLTNNKDAICEGETPYVLLRGRHIGYYELRGNTDPEYVDEDFVCGLQKEKYIRKDRLVCQQIVNMAKKRRMSFALVSKNNVLGNSCNFISIDSNEYGVNYYYLLGILNSDLMDWYFKLTSSNNHINNYEIDNLPIPINYEKKDDLTRLVKEYIAAPKESILSGINELVYDAYNLIDNDSNGKAYMGEKRVTCSKNTSHETITLDAFYNDLHYMISMITKEECEAILTGDTTVKEICFRKKPDIQSFDMKTVESIEKKYKKLNSGMVLNHTTFKLSDLDLEMIGPVPQGGNWKDIPEETVKKSKRLERITQTGGRTTLYGRIDYEKPSYTITTYFNRPGNGTYVHPTHERVISVREAARFQCFPDDYYFYGNKTELLKQIGNAVPVLLAYSIGDSIKKKTGCSTSVDLFSGAGGMTYGFKNAGINAVIANDIIESACVTLKTNSPEIPVVCGDITENKMKDYIINVGKRERADIICGGPPCQGFSMAGFRKEDDPRNKLFRDFVDIVSGVNPKIIVFENVEGILSYDKGNTYRNIIELFSELGYNTEGRKMLASEFGVPQRRKRVIILCTRKDMNIMPEDLFPEKITPIFNDQISARDTIYDLENVECSDEARYKSNFTSPMIKYLKKEIDSEKYLNIIKKNCSSPKLEEQITIFESL